MIFQSFTMDKSAAVMTFITLQMSRCLLINRFVCTVWPTFYSPVDNQRLTYWSVAERKHLFLLSLVSFCCQSRTSSSMMDLERVRIRLPVIRTTNHCWYPPAACQCWGKWNAEEKTPTTAAGLINLLNTQIKRVFAVGPHVCAQYLSTFKQHPFRNYLSVSIPQKQPSEIFHLRCDSLKLEMWQKKKKGGGKQPMNEQPCKWRRLFVSSTRIVRIRVESFAL